MNDGAFVRRTQNEVPYYACAAFEEAPWLRHGFSTRHGGVSAGSKASLNLTRTSWDSAENVVINRRRFLGALDLADVPLATLSQTHSDHLHIIRDKSEDWNSRPQGDALATRLRGVALGVQVADCFPILLLDRQNEAIAAVHSGWKGTLSRLLQKTIMAMQSAYNSAPSQLLAAIGPGIRACCFEVSPEVAGLFVREFAGEDVCREHPLQQGKFFIDLRRALGAQLSAAGVTPGNVFDLQVCTRCRQDEFFSYRGEGPLSGRMMAIIANK